MASGDPQGSILGPLLFDIFISDLSRVLRHSLCRKYADDTQIYLHIALTQINELIVRVQADAQAVAVWPQANGLELNEKKTKVMIMGSMPYFASIDVDRLQEIVIDRTSLQYVDKEKTLALLLHRL